MSLSVLNNISAIYAQNNLTTTQASLQKTLEQLSSGSRINSGADDAAGLSIANGLAANSAALSQSSENASSGVGFLQVADGALSQVNSLLNRGITLATEAGNGTLNAAQNAAAQQEYGDILSEINTIGSSTNFNGNAVFSTGTTNVFTSDGTTTGTNNYSVGVGSLNTASGVGVTAPGASATTLAETAINSVTGSGATSYAAAAGDVYTLTFNAAADTVVGNTVDPFSIQVGSTNYAINVPTAGESVTTLEGQISSALGSNVASVAIAGGVITITGNTGTANAVTLQNASDLYDTTSSAAATVAHGTSSSNAVSYAPAADETYVINGVSAADKWADNNLSVTIGGTTTAVNFTGTGGVDTQAQLITNIATAVGSAYTVAAASSGGGVTITATATGTASNFTINGGVIDELANPGTSTSAASPGQLLSGTNLSTQASAAIALSDIYTAINDISYQRGAIGANINTLTAVSSVESTQNVNVTSASNTITATDYGAATSNLSKYQILSQTGISALAQANSVQQEVLKLLQ